MTMAPKERDDTISLREGATSSSSRQEIPRSSLHVHSSTTPKCARMVLGGASFKSCTVLTPMARTLALMRRPTPHT